MGMNTIQPGTIQRLEQYLDAHIEDEAVRRQAAATRAHLSAWGLSEQVQAASLVIPLMHKNILDDESLAQMAGTQAMTLAQLARKFGLPYTESHPKRSRAYFAGKLRRLFVCAYTDVEATLLCAADHIATTVHLEHLTADRCRTWAAETLAVNLPLLEMLGMWRERQGIADLALAVHDTEAQRRFERYVTDYYQSHERTFSRIQGQLQHHLSDKNVSAEVFWHETTPASLYIRHERSVRQGNPFDPAELGILRMDIHTESERDCYHALGVLHRIWQPSASTPVRDWVAAPRHNGYRAIITQVNTPDGPVEFRIMTQEMADANVRGVLTKKHIKNAWWTKNHLPGQVGIQNTRPLPESICVFTPSGEVYKLRNDSTATDFAFRVHSELGPYAREFYVNGRRRAYDTVLQHRDLVEIRYDQSRPSLTAQWDAVVQTGIAIDGIRRHRRGVVSPVQRGESIFRRVLSREMEIYNVRFTEEQIDASLDKATREHRLHSCDELFTRIAGGEVAPDAVVADMIESELMLYVQMPDDVRRRYMPKLKFSRVWMQQQGFQKFNRQNRIRPGVEIVGELTHDRDDDYALIVHRVEDLDRSNRVEPIPLAWEANQQKSIQVTVTTSANRRGVWSVIQAIEYAFQTHAQIESRLHNFRVESSSGTSASRIEFVVECEDPAAIEALHTELSELKTAQIIDIYQIYELFPGQRRLATDASSKLHSNPFTPAHITNQDMFYGRGREQQQVLHAIKSGQRFLILHGQKRIGKTSLIHYLCHEAIPNDDELDVIPVMFDMLQASPVTAESFARGLITAAEGVVERKLQRKDQRRLKFVRRNLSKRPMTTLRRWVKTAEQYLYGRRLLFLIDEFTAVEEAYEQGHLDDSFFQQIHHIVDHDQVAFLLCIHNHVLRNLTSKLGDITQRGQLVPIDLMDTVDARALISKPFERHYEVDDDAIALLQVLTSGHPFFIHTLCGQLFTNMSFNNTEHVTVQEVRVAVSQIAGQTHHHLAHYLGENPDRNLDVLRVITFLCMQSENGLADSQRIYDWLTDVTNPRLYTHEEVSVAIRTLHESGAIQRRGVETETFYRIRVQLLFEYAKGLTEYLKRNTERFDYDEQRV